MLSRKATNAYQIFDPGVYYNVGTLFRA